MPESVSPARRKNRHIAASRTFAVRNKAKYDPIDAEDKQQEDETYHNQGDWLYDGNIGGSCVSAKLLEGY